MLRAPYRSVASAVLHRYAAPRAAISFSTGAQRRAACVAAPLPSVRSVAAAALLRQPLLRQPVQQMAAPTRRSLCDGPKKGAAGAGPGAAASEETAIVLTPYQKVAKATSSTLWIGLAGLAVACGYLIVTELMPSRNAPGSLFDEAVSFLRDDPEVTARLGTPVKGYGRDHGGHREGRRNFIQHTEMDDARTGQKHTRIKFNLEGPYQKAFVFAEVAQDMGKGEWVYVILQMKGTGEVHTVVDNRNALAAGGGTLKNNPLAKLAGD